MAQAEPAQRGERPDVPALELVPTVGQEDEQILQGGLGLRLGQLMDRQDRFHVRSEPGEELGHGFLGRISPGIGSRAACGHDGRFSPSTLAEKGRGHDRIRLVIAERISRFIQSPAAPDAGSFEELALAAFASRSGASVSDWRQVPLAPAAPHLSDPDLFRQVIDATFPRFCLPHLAASARLPILSLIPTRDQEPDSRLSLLAEHVIARHGGPESAATVGSRGVEVAKARSWAGARQREGHPVLVLATTPALTQWLDGLDRLDLRFRLPPGSVLFEIGDLPGREDLLRRIAERLGLPAGQVVRGYWSPGMTSLCCTRALYGEDPDLFVAPAWVRVRVLDPETLAEAPAGQPGRIAVFDLANPGSALHLLTEDVGVIDGSGFRLAAAATGPPPRPGLPPEAPG